MKKCSVVKHVSETSGRRSRIAEASVVPCCRTSSTLPAGNSGAASESNWSELDLRRLRCVPSLLLRDLRFMMLSVAAAARRSEDLCGEPGAARGESEQSALSPTIAAGGFPAESIANSLQRKRFHFAAQAITTSASFRQVNLQWQHRSRKQQPDRLNCPLVSNTDGNLPVRICLTAKSLIALIAVSV